MTKDEHEAREALLTAMEEYLHLNRRIAIVIDEVPVAKSGDRSARYALLQPLLKEASGRVDDASARCMKWALAHS